MLATVPVQRRSGVGLCFDRVKPRYVNLEGLGRKYFRVKLGSHRLPPHHPSRLVTSAPSLLRENSTASSQRPSNE